jgi:hypothetical protein
MLSLACGIISIYINKNLDDETDEVIGYLASGLLIMGGLLNITPFIIAGGILEATIIYVNLLPGK